MMFLSREWAKLGHEVTNFVNVEQSRRFDESNSAAWKGQKPGTFGGVFGAEGIGTPPLFKAEGYHEYVPLNLTRPMLANFPWDAVVAWECPSVFEDHRIRDNVKVKLCEMQVAHFGKWPEDEMRAAEAYCDYVCALSDWHAEFLLHSGLNMPRERVLTLPNGVDISRYPRDEVMKKIEAGNASPPKFVYSSSPDRGLWQLLQAWRHIRKAFPGAELQVAYGVYKLIIQLAWMHSRQAEMAVEIHRLMDQPGVVDLDKIGQTELSQRQLAADAWLYPLDSIQATETGCITAVENAAAGNPLITTDCDCMEAEFGPVGVICQLPFEAKGYAEAVEYVLGDVNVWRDLAETGRAFAETRDWSLIAPQWLQYFENAPS